MRSQTSALVRSIGLVLAISLAGACTKADFVSQLPPDAGSAQVAGEAGLPPPLPTAGSGGAPWPPRWNGTTIPMTKTCTPEATAFYYYVLSLYFMLDNKCEVTAFPDGVPGLDAFSGQQMDPPKGPEATWCETHPYAWWAVPMLPLPPKKVVYCKEACERALNVVACLATSNPCHTVVDDRDAGIDATDCTQLGMR